MKNRVDHARLLGIDVSASGIRQYEVRGNRAFANGRVGLHLGPATDDVLVRDNKAVGNPLDCQDESKGESAADGTAGTENHWERNLGRSALPPSLCSPPPIPNRPSHHGGGEPPKPGKPRDCRCTLPWRL